MVKLNPFTPRSGMGPKVFVGREEEIAFFKKKLEEAKENRFNHYVILGEWGIGKTALLKYLKNTSQEEGNYCAYFTASEFSPNTHYREVAVHIVREILRNLPVKLEGEGRFLKGIRGFGFQILGTGLSLDLHAEKEFAFDPQIFLLESLRSLWQDVEKETDLVAVLIDDVQNYKNVSGIFTILKNVLSDDAILTSKFLFILSSTLGGWDEFLMKHHPIGRYFFPRRNLKPFSKQESLNMITETLKTTGVHFSKFVCDQIWDYTQGHLFEIHTLCSALYDSQFRDKVGNGEWELGYANGLKVLGENVFDHLIAEASEKEKEMLHVLSFFEEATTPEKVDEKTRKIGLNFSNPRVILRRLVDKNLVENPDRGHYLIGDKLFREYIKLKSK